MPTGRSVIDGDASAPRTLLLKLELGGFRSIASEELDFRPINVLIGPNGAGKSNLIAFFRMLSFMLSAEQGSPGMSPRLGEQARCSTMGRR